MATTNGVVQFDTQTSRPWDKPQLQNSVDVKIPVNDVHLVPALTQFDMALSNNIRIKTYVDKYATGKAVTHMDSWADSVFYSGAASLFEVNETDRDFQTGDWAGKPTGSGEQVKFARAFAAPPQVVVWLTGFDFTKGKNFRIKAEAQNVDQAGFLLNISTWYDTQLNWAAASWVVYPTGSPTVASGSYNTVEDHPWNKPQLQTSGKVSFPTGKFVGGAPQIVAGINTFDVDASTGTSVRLKSYQTDVTSQGFTWNLDTWYDTKLYAMGASYIALQV